MTTHVINGRTVHITRHAAQRFLDLALAPYTDREHRNNYTRRNT